MLLNCCISSPETARITALTLLTIKVNGSSDQTLLVHFCGDDTRQDKKSVNNFVMNQINKVICAATFY